MSQGQPALLYIVPLMLIPTFIIACIRGELKRIWNGNVAPVIDDNAQIIDNALLTVAPDAQMSGAQVALMSSAQDNDASSNDDDDEDDEDEKEGTPVTPVSRQKTLPSKSHPQHQLARPIQQHKDRRPVPQDEQRRSVPQHEQRGSVPQHEQRGSVPQHEHRGSVPQH